MFSLTLTAKDGRKFVSCKMPDLKAITLEARAAEKEGFKTEIGVVQW